MGEAPPPFKVRLGVERKAVRAGGKLRIRVENFGTELVAYGFPYSLARFEQGAWVKLPTGPFLMPLLHAQPGYAGECQVVGIAKDAEAGLYRIAKEIRPFDPDRPKAARKAVVIRTTFRVR